MTQITRKSVPMRGLILLLTVTLGAGLVLVGCGDDDTATTPAPAPPPPPPPPAPEPEPEPEPPAPEAPATPTGLMVSETTETSITWTWNTSEGALGYAVQVSLDEMFDDTDEIGLTLETSFTATPLPSNTSVFLRVRAGTGTPEALAAAVATGSLEGLVLSDWTTHVTGMSNMPPPEPEPEPEPMAPVMVEFMIPDGENPMEADDGDDEETAMATVNHGIMVKSNTTAVITPMFVEDAAGVSITAVDGNMPFAYVDWSRLQADVVSDGATFMIQRTTIGANQEMEPTGDVSHVTCGPFRCIEGMDAPEVTIDDSMACTMWEPTLDLDVGLIDNSLSEHTGVAYVAAAGDDAVVVEVTVFDGLDLGWTYTSSLDVNVMHDLTVVSSEAKAGKKSSETPLGASSIGKVTLGRDQGDETDQTYFALSAEPDETATTDAVDADNTDIGSCQPLSSAMYWDYNDNLSSRISKPDNCFRMTVDHGLGRNYLDAYTVTLDPLGADVTWGEIAWEDWEDLTCGSMDFVAMEQVDVCAMFEEEVASLPTPDAVPIVTTTDEVSAQSNLTGPSLAGFDLDYDGAAAARHRFTAMWYARGKEMPPPNLYADGDDDDTDPDDMVRGASGAAWVKTLDKDFDPTEGDLGKVSIDGDDEADNFADGDDSRDCTADDGGSAATGKDGGDNNSTLCNAEDVEIEAEVTFPLGLGYGCDAVKKTYTLTCDWDARGNRTNNVNATLAVIADDGANIGDFVKCSVE